MTAYTAEVLNIINERIDVLNAQLKLHKGTVHEYPLAAGLYELMNLGTKVQGLANQEKLEIQKRRERDNEISWRLNPDKSGGAFTDAEICRSREERW